MSDSRASQKYGHWATAGVLAAFASVFAVNAYLVHVAIRTPSHLIETGSAYEKSLKHNAQMEAEKHWFERWGIGALILNCEKRILTVRWSLARPSPALSIRGVSATHPERDFSATLPKGWASHAHSDRPHSAFPNPLTPGMWWIDAEADSGEIFKARLYCSP